MGLRGKDCREIDGTQDEEYGDKCATCSWLGNELSLRRQLPQSVRLLRGQGRVHRMEISREGEAENTLGRRACRHGSSLLPSRRMWATNTGRLCLVAGVGATSLKRCSRTGDLPTLTRAAAQT